MRRAVIYGWGILLIGQMLFMALLIATAEDTPSRAILSMGVVLVVVWVGVGGALQLRFRAAIRRRVQAATVDWRVMFVLLATALALVEEAITTTLSNLAPLFGVPVGAAYITASPDYLEVVLLHSVVVFVPMFIAWAWLLSRYDFHPTTVFVLFGLTGALGEAISFGANPIAVPMWVFIYGLLVYLPAYCVPPDRGARRVRWWAHYPLAVCLPVLAAIPVALLVMQFHPTPQQFPPLSLGG